VHNCALQYASLVHKIKGIIPANLNKIKGIIPVNPPRNETIAETTVKQKRPNRRFSKKTRNTRTAINPRVEEESEQFHPINISNKILTDDEKSLLSKGPSFCPTPKDVNRLKLAEDWENFESRLRSAVLFKQIDQKKIHPSMRARNYYRSLGVSPQGEPQYLNHCPWRTFYNW
jgi:hypothetical protein